jgi:UDP-N-acetyl-D-galactosamine dehydrogenase
MKINTYEVLEAAGTKWNFLNFKPGLVGGHCIGVDPYYLTHKAEKLGYHAQIINSGRFVNDSMGGYVAKQVVKKIIAQGINIQEARALVLGATFKENVSDIRNSKVVDTVRELESFGVSVDVVDPQASAAEIKHEYGYDLKPAPTGKYDAVVVAVNHHEYTGLPEAHFADFLKPTAVFADLKGIYRGKITKYFYWSL